MHPARSIWYKLTLVRRLLPFAIVLAALLVPVTAANAEGPIGSVAPGCNNDYDYEVCFNDPRSPDIAKRDVIFTRIRQMVDLARKGDEVHGAMFSWTSAGAGVARALARAHRRGADTRVVVGNGTSKRIVKYLRKRKVEVKVCQVACISKAKGSINHVKLFLLKLGGRKHTIVTSSNLTTPQRDKLFNNSIRSARDDALYDFYRSYWQRLRDGDWKGWNSDGQRQVLTAAGNLGIAFPRSRDVVADLLSQVRACPVGHAKVWIAMNIFTGGRPAVNRQLRRLQGIGCNVRLIIGPHVNKAVAGAGLRPSKVRRAPVHHKFMLLDAQVVGRIRQIVFTGSQNLSASALAKNDEIWAGYSAALPTTAFALRFDYLYDNVAKP